MRATVPHVHVDTSATKARCGFGLQNPNGTGHARRTSCTTSYLADDLGNWRKMTACMPTLRIGAQTWHLGSSKTIRKTHACNHYYCTPTTDGHPQAPMYTPNARTVGAAIRFNKDARAPHTIQSHGCHTCASGEFSAHTTHIHVHDT